LHLQLFVDYCCNVAVFVKYNSVFCVFECVFGYFEIRRLAVFLVCNLNIINLVAYTVNIRDKHNFQRFALLCNNLRRNFFAVFVNDLDASCVVVKLNCRLNGTLALCRNGVVNNYGALLAP